MIQTMIFLSDMDIEKEINEAQGRIDSFIKQSATKWEEWFQFWHIYQTTGIILYSQKEVAEKVSHIMAYNLFNINNES